MTDRLKVSLTNMSNRYKEGIYALTTQIYNTIDGGKEIILNITLSFIY